MGEQVVGLFQREASAVEAGWLIRDAGYPLDSLDLVSLEDTQEAGPTPPARYIRAGKLLERPEGMWPCAIRWGIIGSIVVEVPVLVWVLLAFDSWGTQVLLAITLWKIGTLFGALWGAIAGANRGLESRVANRYQYYLEQGTWALVARVGRYHAPLARGVLIESGAFDIRNVEGSFVARPGSAATNQTTRKGASPTVKNIWMSKT